MGKFHSEQFSQFCSSPDTWMIKLRSVRWEGHLEAWGKWRTHTSVWSVGSRRHVWGVILKWN